MSEPGEIRPASPTNIMGKLSGDLELLRNISAGTNLRVIKK